DRRGGHAGDRRERGRRARLPRRGHRARQRPLPPAGRQPRPDRGGGLRTRRTRVRSRPAGLLERRKGSREGATVRVRALLDPAAGLGLRLDAGDKGLDHVVTLSRVQRPGLALTGYTEYIRYGRVQILGASEVGYLRKLSAVRRGAVLRRLASCRISCFVVTKDLEPPAELRTAAQAPG